MYKSVSYLNRRLPKAKGTKSKGMNAKKMKVWRMALRMSDSTTLPASARSKTIQRISVPFEWAGEVGGKLSANGGNLR